MNQPRKQAQQARSRVTQAAILEAAARILEQQGRAGLTTNRIALRAGVSIGSLYQYFPNKEAILATLLRDKRAHMLALMRGAMDAAPEMTAEAAAGALIRAAMAYHLSRPALTRELDALAPDLDVADETAELAAEMAGLVQTTLRRIDPAAGPEEARDVVAICKALIAASPGGDGETLFRRCHRAVVGYLRQGAGRGVTPPAC